MSHPSLKLNPTTKDMDKVRMIANIIVESIRESDRGMGVPAGPMYAALMAYGCTLDQFNMLMSGLVRVGRLTRSGDLYRCADRAI
jgi:hypothetical protein